MLEELCRGPMLSLCKNEIKKAPLVAMKGKPWKKVPQFIDFVDEGARNDWSCLPLKRVFYQREDSTMTIAWHWFNDKAENICNSYLRKKYGGVCEAIKETGAFSVLFNQFKKDFAERKRKVMEKELTEVNAVQATLAAKGKLPQSHGGVANLLKVLTKTMYQQGANVASIAKMQYMVCIQAGICLPDEFLTDVLTANAELEEVG